MTTVPKRCSDVIYACCLTRVVLVAGRAVVMVVAPEAGLVVAGLGKVVRAGLAAVEGWVVIQGLVEALVVAGQ